MRKLLFTLMLVVVGAFVGGLLSPPRPPAWQPKTQIVFEGFVDSTTIPPVTNVWRVTSPSLAVLAAGPPAMYALFEIKDSPPGEIAWHLNEVSQEEAGNWKPSGPGTLRMVSGSIHLRAAVAVPTTNAPLRVVMELEEFQPNLQKPPAGKVAQSFWNLRMRWKRWRYPNDAKQWLPRGALFRITNEFNFAAGTNTAVGDKAAAH